VSTPTPTPNPQLESAELPPEPEAAQGEWLPFAPPPAPTAHKGSASSAKAPALPPVELLAPAGGPDAGYAAFHYGADAIYLGLKKFSARAEAENFSLSELDEIAAFAHAAKPRRRVFVTLNTVVQQGELEELVNALGALAEIGVDALIVQDLGVAALARKHFPELELHASTQLAVHNRQGAEALKALGFTRVVLARELTFEEIREITANAGIETEVFVHGALCYAYSGLCLFSAQTLGRSGNRGKCTYSCRESYKITGAPNTLRDGTPTKRDPSFGFPFSMKDLALPDHLPALREAGVSCFKIEGRKKNPYFVAATVDYYKKLLGGTLSGTARAAHESDMQTIFSRPWTRLFVGSHRDKEVADRDASTHVGAPIGKVEGFENDEDGAWLRFTTSRRLEVRDGLQSNWPGLMKPFGFSLERMRYALGGGGALPPRSTRPLFEVAAGTRIEVLLPETRPEVPVGATMYHSMSQAVRQRFRTDRPKPGAYRVRRAVEIDLLLKPEALSWTAHVPARRADGEALELSGKLAGPFEPAREPAKTEAAARTAFERLGETNLELAKLALNNPKGLFVPVSRLNALRREVADAVEAEIHDAYHARLANVHAEVFPPPATVKLSGGRAGEAAGKRFAWALKVDRLAFLDAFTPEDWTDVEEVVVDIARDHAGTLAEKLAALAEKCGRERIRLALPAITRKWEEKDILRKLEGLRAAGWQKWEASNISAWSFLKPLPADLAADWPIYTLNRASIEAVLGLGATRVTLSPEDGLGNLRALLNEYATRAQIVVHQDTPLFQAESCAYANLIGGCPGKANCRFEDMQLVSESGEKVWALDYHCRTIVLNQGAFCLSPFLDELAGLGAKRLRADFIFRPYTPEEVAARWRQIRAGQNVPAGHAANFRRGLQ